MRRVTFALVTDHRVVGDLFGHGEFEDREQEGGLGPQEADAVCGSHEEVAQIVSDRVHHHKAFPRCEEVRQSNHVGKKLRKGIHRQLAALVWRGNEYDAADVLSGLEVHDLEQVVPCRRADFELLRRSVRELLP